MGITNVGLPGKTGTAVSMSSRNIFKRIDGAQWSDVFSIIDGGESRDTDNSTHPHVLQAGHVLAKDTSDNKYKSAFLGVVTAESTGTTLNVSAATATEITRRYGSSGTAEFSVMFDANIGVDSGESVIAKEDITHSVVGATTITVTALSVAMPIGSIIVAGEALDTTDPNFDLENMLIVAEQHGIRVTDNDDTSVDVTLDRIAVGGQIDVSMLKFYSSLSSADLKAWFKNELNKGRQFIFSDDI